MNVGIITFHSANNYGAVLQCYALSSVLKDQGHDVRLIDLPLHEKPVGIRPKLRNKIRSKAFSSFRKVYLPVVVGPSSAKDVYVFGSDQIWNLQITKSNYRSFFGDWIDREVAKISYAASFGVGTWDFPEYTNLISEELRSFSAVGVREASAVEICKNEFDIASEKVLDPTLLLDTYEGVFKKREKTSTLVCYIFAKNEEKIKHIKSIGAKCDLRTVLLNDFRIRRNIKSVPFPSISTWLSYLDSSEMVLTDSFHCMVFAIIFKKNFIAIPAIPERAGRMLSLLKDLGLERRFFNDIADVNASNVTSENINYLEVDGRLSLLRHRSLDFLRNSMGLVKC